MLAIVNGCVKSMLFNMLHYYLLLSSGYFLVFCEENASYKDLKIISNNLTVPFDGMTRSDRTLNNQEIESKFFIKANVIIRTGESRALGAKYINETRLPTNHDCLIWCLETPSCNTAVHEEKNMQSCYMFDCGSPAKPLCKFTQHNFFTSSVLRMSQHSYELSQWGRQVQQERENVDQKSDVSTTTPAPLDNKLTVATTSVYSVTNEHSESKGSPCHHYQFQCVNNSECIAIYNVCDGIPQCPDGSDESLELNCPSKGTLKGNFNGKDRADAPPAVINITPPLKLQPPSVKPSAAQTESHDQNAPSYKKAPDPKEAQHKNSKGMWQNPYSGMPMSKAGYHHQVENADGLGSPFVHKHSQFISANDPHVQGLNRWSSDYDQYPPHSTSLEQQYNPFDRIDEQYLSNQLSPDYETGAKNYASYHQDDIPYWPNQDILQYNSYTVDEFPQPGVQSLNKPINYPDKENIYAQQIARNEQYPEAKLGLHSKQLMNSNEPADMEDYKLRRFPHPRPQQPYMALEDSLQHYSNYPHTKAKDYSDSLPNLEDYNNDDLIRASLVNQLPKKIDQIHHTHDHNLKHLDKDMLHPSPKEKTEPKSTEATKDNSLIIVKPTSHAKAIQRTVLDFKMSMAELYQSSSTHTHEANSAILALVLGVTVSFFLIILLACRMKTLRRRMSRKGRALAHDADYLVNGMYL